MENPETSKGHKLDAQNKVNFAIDNTQFYLLVFFAFVSPLAWSKSVVNGYFFTKLLILYWVVILLFASFLFKLIFGKIYFKRTYLDIPIILFAILFLISTLNSIHLPTSVFGRYNYGEGIFVFASYLILFFAAANVGWTPKKVRFLSSAFVLSALIVSLLGVAEFFGYGKLSGGAMGSFGSRISSTLGNPVFLGAFLAMVLPIVFVKYLESKDLRNFSFFGGTLLLTLVVLAMSLSLAGWLAAMIGVIIFFLLSGKDYLRQKKGLLIVLLLVVMGLLLVGNAILSHRGESAVQRVTTILTGQGTMSTRMENWKSAIIIIGKRPIFGWGPATYRIPMNTYMTLGKIRLEARAVDADAHNVLLNTAATLGLPAFLVLLFMFGIFVWRGILIVKKSEPDIKPMTVVLFAAAVGYMAFWQLNPSSVTTTPFWWLLAGVVMGQRPVSEHSLNIKVPSIFKFLLGFLIVLVTVFGLYQALRPFLADMYYRSGVLKSMFQRDEVTADGSFQRAIKYAPYEKTYYLMAGDNWSKRYDGTKVEEDFNKAIKEYKRILKINDVEPEAYIHMSNAYMSLKTKDGYQHAVKYLVKVVEIMPYHATAHDAKGDSHWELGEFKEALLEYQEAAKIEPNTAPFQFKIGRCYEGLGQKEKALEAYEAAYVLDNKFTEALEAIKRLNEES
ncbi:MAG TPA: tetratricopeptide repeat protein [Actinobacteria bacterium]|nr:tetratricopeptide repeat protein [Actinomycetota bacterium]